MAFPTYTRAVSSETVNTTTHDWTLPSGNAAGKLLVLIISSDGAPTISGLTGFTQVGSDVSPTGCKSAIYAKITDGSEASSTWASSVGEKSVTQSLLFSGAHASAMPEMASATGTSGTADAPNLTPSWGALDTSWFVSVLASSNNENTGTWGSLSSFSLVDLEASAEESSADVQTGLWTRDLNASSLNPGTVAISDAGTTWGAITLAIRPAAATPVVVTPDPADVTTSTTGPTVVMGALAITPAAADVTTSATGPVVVLGALTVSPSAADAAASTTGPSGAVVVTPAPADAVTSTIGPRLLNYAAYGRKPIGISQEPGQGGYDYPLLTPDDSIKKLLADAYLAYEDRTGQFELPFRIQYLYGFGQTDVTVPIAPVHSHEVLIVDANDATVFDSLTVSPSRFNTVDWADRLRVLEWTDPSGQTLRIVYHTAWDEDDNDEARHYDEYIEPVSAELDARAVYQLPQRVTGLRVELTTIQPDAAGGNNQVQLVNGYNTTLDVAETVETDGGRRSTAITLNAQANTGRGRFGDGCDDDSPVIRRIANQGPSSRGNFILDSGSRDGGGGCYRIERPFVSVLTPRDPGITAETVRIQHHALQLINDCGPCCDCNDFINVWEALRRMRNEYATLVSRAQSARDLYHDNRDRWLAAIACREAEFVRAILQPVPGNQTNISVALCNNTGRCLQGVVLHVSFEYTDGTGNCDEAANTTATFDSVVNGTTTRSGNVLPSNPNTGGQPTTQEYYTLGGEYPYFYAYFDAINPSALGTVSFRANWSGDSSTQIDMIVEAFEVGANPPITSGSPVPGYVLGAGPVSTPLGLALMPCPIKRSATLLP